MGPLSPGSVPAAARRPSVAFLLLAGLVIAAGVAVRVALLGRQSYWIDELFSVNESAGSLRNLSRTGATEVHTPFYAGLLWLWMRLGGTHEVWTRLLSTVCAITSVLVTQRGLRAVRLSQHIRWALTAATAASGTSIVYSLETRSYALLMLGSIGLTVTTLHAGVLTLDGDDVPGRTYLAWGGWGLLSATAHLFGAVLVLGSLAVLTVLTMYRGRPGRAGRILTWVLIAAAGCGPQLGWLLRGLSRPGFASGTDWIQAPRGQDVWDLLTTTFASGSLIAHKDGFAWTSPAGVLGAAAMVLVAIMSGSVWPAARAAVRKPRAPDGEPVRAPARTATTETQAAAILLALATIVLGSVFGVSQITHIWTLRNLVIVTPALVWGVICLAAAATRTDRGRRHVAGVAVALLGLSLVPTAAGVAHPYKTDFRGLFEYLITVRTQQPDATFVFYRAPLPTSGTPGPTPPRGWQNASDRSGRDPDWAELYRQARVLPTSSYPPASRPTAPEVVIFYHGVADHYVDREAALLAARLGTGYCRPVPIYGLIVVRCH